MFSFNCISNIEPLRGLSNLQDLNLIGNPIEDYSAIEHHLNFNYYVYGEDDEQFKRLLKYIIQPLYD
ncbi:Leucine-rich_repeat domain superfamily [Hexamita inflata]|uniref:Leucine-rich repeat domain superfamily n=1 Tax=Hexamita inflata TaxID=28002 RepID=A0AA86QH21_9EUKA|nr:Leucine-rich repeat domain superfamily [Hexamita inflata]